MHVILLLLLNRKAIFSSNLYKHTVLTIDESYLLFKHAVSGVTKNIMTPL